MAVVIKTYGPPGTGKTTRLIERVEEERKGVLLENMAYLSFSVAAKEVIKERLKATERELRWFRTIHGACTKDLGIAGSIVNWTHYRKFHDLTGMKITPDDADDYLDGGDMDFNVALRAWNLSLTTMRSSREIIRELPDHPNLAERRFTAFVEAWVKFKRENHLFDFMDMLTEYARIGTPLEIDVGFLDESQDLSKLQWVCLEKLFAKAKRIYMAGDDDQAIYTFLGGSEYGFLDHASDEDEVLTRSYRCPQAVGREADRIIKKIAHRKDKVVEWRDEQGAVSRMNQDAFGMPWRQWQGQYESVMVLTRHRKGAQAFSDSLKGLGVAHSLNGETMNTWAEAKVLHTLYSLRDGKAVTPRQAIGLVEALGRDASKFRELSRRERVREVEGVDLHSLDWLTTFATTRRSRVRFQQLQRLVRAEGYESLASDPKIVVSTMHASKGKEADLVVILPDCTGIVRRNIATPTETRLAYVALTRAKREAMIVVPRTDSYITHFFA